MEDSLAEDRHSPVPGPRPSLPGPRPDAGHDPVRELLPLLHADRGSSATRPRTSTAATTRPSSSTCAGRRRSATSSSRGGDGLTLAPKLFESILRGLREIPHIEIIRIGSRVPVFLPQRIDDELCEMLEKYHPLWINLHFNHPNEITPEVSRGGRQADQGRPAGRQPERPARRRQRLRPHPARARPPAGREPDPALLPLPVRPRRGLRPLPDAGRQGPRDHGGPARPHLAATRSRPTSSTRPAAAARSRSCPTTSSATRTTRSCCATTRATSRPTRSRRPTSSTTRRACAYCQHERPEPGQSGVLGLLEGERMWIEPKGFEEIHTRGNTEAHRLQDPSKWVPFGVGAIEGDVARRRCRCSRRATPAGERRRERHGLRPGRGAAAARGRADRLGPRGAALDRSGRSDAAPGSSGARRAPAGTSDRERPAPRRRRRASRAATARRFGSRRPSRATGPAIRDASPRHR